MWKNIVESESPLVTIWHLRIACWIPKATDTLTICNTYCLSAATLVARTRLNATLYVHNLYCWKWAQFNTVTSNGCVCSILPQSPSSPTGEHSSFIFFRFQVVCSVRELSLVHPAKYWCTFNWVMAVLSTTSPNFHRQSCILRILSYRRLCVYECRSLSAATFQAHIWETPVFSYTVCVLFSLSWYVIGTVCHSPSERALQLTLCVNKRRNVCGFDTCIAKSIFSSFLQYSWPRSVRSLFHCCPASTPCCCCVVSIHELVININTALPTYHAPLYAVSLAVVGPGVCGWGGVCVC
jgi:hypothetical protein